MNGQLLAVKGRTYTKPFQLAEGKNILFGRGEDCDVQVLDPSLSRRQCELEMRGGQFVLRDAKSMNGTWVNGSRIEEALLKDGDNVQLGAVKFVFHVLPERRRRAANLPATVPENIPPDGMRQKLDPDRSSLMALPSELQSVENLRRVQRDLSTIYRIGNFIHSEKDPVKLYDSILAAIAEVIAADRCVLLLNDQSTPAFVPQSGTDKSAVEPAHGTTAGKPARAKKPALRAVAGRSADGKPLHAIQFSRTVAEESFTSGMCILRANVQDDSHFADAESIMRDSITSVMCVPVESPDGILGVLYVDALGQSEGFHAHDLELLAAVGKQAGIAIRRHQLQEEVRGGFFGTVRALVASIEAKDKYTKGHSDRVTRYALQIGVKMGFSSEELQTLELACLLHDVGKIGVMESILLKPGKLTRHESEIVKRHPETGAGIIRNIQSAENICQIVRYHHERWDGRGYPAHFAGEDIPLPARVLAIADTLDAMTSHRPYRKTPGLKNVRKALKAEQGRQFDAKVAALTLDMLRKGELKIRSVTQKKAVGKRKS